jgi:hypothetical protein
MKPTVDSAANKQESRITLIVDNDNFAEAVARGRKVHEFVEALYTIEEELRECPDGQTASKLWVAWTAMLVLQMELMTSVKKKAPPGYLLTLLNEIVNLKEGVPARLLRLDGASLGNNPHSAFTYSMQVNAAAYLRRFMDRDGKGAQKAAAEKIAKAMEEAGVFAPGRDRKPYMGRTVIEWLRQAERKGSTFSNDYREILAMLKRSDAENLEASLASFAEMLKLQVFEPHGT